MEITTRGKDSSIPIGSTRLSLKIVKTEIIQHIMTIVGNKTKLPEIIYVWTSDNSKDTIVYFYTGEQLPFRSIRIKT